jgi:hypothetical protein
VVPAALNQLSLDVLCVMCSRSLFRDLNTWLTWGCTTHLLLTVPQAHHGSTCCWAMVDSSLSHARPSLPVFALQIIFTFGGHCMLL